MSLHPHEFRDVPIEYTLPEITQTLILTWVSGRTPVLEWEK